MANQVEPHRQADVTFFDTVVDRIDQHRHLQIEIDLAQGRHRFSLGVAPRLAEADVLVQIFGNAPAIVGVGFPYVNDAE